MCIINAIASGGYSPCAECHEMFKAAESVVVIVYDNGSTKIMHGHCWNDSNNHTYE